MQTWALGAGLMAFCEKEAPRITSLHERLRLQLERVISIQEKRLEDLLLGDTGDVPEGYTEETYRDYLVGLCAGNIAANVAVLEKMVGNYLKMTAGGAGAVWAAMQRASVDMALASRRAEHKDGDEVELVPDGKDRTPRRKRYGAGEAQVIEVS